MCEFVSWIEKDGKNYFLTGADLASKRGKALRKHCRSDDDLPGHGAIRWFYGEFTGGIDKEHTDFRNPKRFPPEIVEAIKGGLMRGMATPQGLLSQAAYAEYRKVTQAAYAEYRKVTQAAYAEYEKVTQPAEAEYRKVTQPAYAEYEKVTQAAEAEYRKVTQPAFWDLFADPQNREHAWR